MAISLSWWSPGSAYLHSSVHPYKSSDTGDSNQDRQLALTICFWTRSQSETKDTLTTIDFLHDTASSTEGGQFVSLFEGGTGRLPFKAHSLAFQFYLELFPLYPVLCITNIQSLSAHFTNLTFPSALAKFAFFVSSANIPSQVKSVLRLRGFELLAGSDLWSGFCHHCVYSA